jgi:hypothetical protein
VVTQAASLAASAGSLQGTLTLPPATPAAARDSALSMYWRAFSVATMLGAS